MNREENTQQDIPTLNEKVAQKGEPAEESAEAQPVGEQDPAEEATDGVNAAELEKAVAEMNKFKDQYVRAHAEMENIRRRADIDVSNARKFGIERFAGELLGVKDSLELASNVDIDDGSADALKSMREGLELTLKMLIKAFDQFNVEEINPEPGEKLNPEIHQAMSMVPSDEFGANQIVQVVQKGYKIHDRLLRPAMVMVAKP